MNDFDGQVQGIFDFEGLYFKGVKLDHMLLLETNSQSYIGIQMAPSPSHLILSDLEGQSHGVSDFEW